MEPPRDAARYPPTLNFVLAALGSGPRALKAKRARRRFESTAAFAFSAALTYTLLRPAAFSLTAAAAERILSSSGLRGPMSDTGSMDDAGFRRWMDAYRSAYERRDPDGAATLFADDATYQWGPFGDLLRGSAAIRERWAVAVGDSRETDYRFDYEVLAVTEELGVARWMASAAVASRGIRLRYDGVFAVALDGDGLCREFREWWHASETALGA